VANDTARLRERRRRRWAVLAVLFPLFFLMVIGVGVAAMYYRRMEFFKPPAVGALPVDRALGAAAARAPRWMPARPPA